MKNCVFILFYFTAVREGVVKIGEPWQDMTVKKNMPALKYYHDLSFGKLLQMQALCLIWFFDFLILLSKMSKFAFWYFTKLLGTFPSFDDRLWLPLFNTYCSGKYSTVYRYLRQNEMWTMEWNNKSAETNVARTSDVTASPNTSKKNPWRISQKTEKATRKTKGKTGCKPYGKIWTASEST